MKEHAPTHVIGKGRPLKKGRPFTFDLHTTYKTFRKHVWDEYKQQLKGLDFDEKCKLLYKFLKSRNFSGEAHNQVSSYIYYLKNHDLSHFKSLNRKERAKKRGLSI